MEGLDVRRLALILAKQAEIEGMTAENQWLIARGEYPKYRESHFQEKGNDMQNLAYTHDLQLFG